MNALVGDFTRIAISQWRRNEGIRWRHVRETMQFHVSLKGLIM
jgi:hypothetical protein